MLLKRLKRKKVKLIEDSADKKTADLIRAVADGHFANVRDLLQQGGDVNTVDEFGDRLLHIAVKNGHDKITWLLLDHGGNINADGQNGFTPLHVAAECGHAGLCEMLLANGADPNMLEEEGLTALHVAAAHGHADVVEVLLENGADPLARDQHGRMSIDFAADFQHSDCLRKLQQFTGASPQSAQSLFTPMTKQPPILDRRDSIMSSSTWLTQSQDSITRSFNPIVPNTNDKKGLWRGTPRSTSAGDKSENPSFLQTGGSVRSMNSAVQSSLWNSTDVLEMQLNQQLKEGVTFGDSNQYTVRKAKHATMASVAWVRDKGTGEDLFAKLYVHEAAFEVEKDFYLFWKNMGENAAKCVGDLFPVLRDLYCEGQLESMPVSCLVMEKADLTLEERSQMGKLLGGGHHSAMELLRSMEHVCCAIKVMHDWGWVHRDLKPSNIMFFGSQQRWKVVDFGITAKSSDRVGIQYTMRYAPPEVVKAQFDGLEDISAHPSQDMWSLGLVLIYLYTNKTPFADIALKEWLQMLLGQASFPFETDATWFEKNLPEPIQGVVPHLLVREACLRWSIDAVLCGLPLCDPLSTQIMSGSHLASMVSSISLQKKPEVRRINAQPRGRGCPVRVEDFA